MPVRLTSSVQVYTSERYETLRGGWQCFEKVEYDAATTTEEERKTTKGSLRAIGIVRKKDDERSGELGRREEEKASKIYSAGSSSFTPPGTDRAGEGATETTEILRFYAIPRFDRLPVSATVGFHGF